MAKLSEEEIFFLITNYPTMGKYWCCEQLDKNESTIRTTAARLGLRIDKTSDFFKEFQKRAAQSKRGKKRPEHAKLMKQYAKDGRLPILTQHTEEQNKNISIKNKEWFKTHEHPKGMLGKHHTPEMCKKHLKEQNVYGKILRLR